MELRTYNQILNSFKDFATNHPQINSYDVGTELQVDTKKIEDFPKMFILIGPSVYTNPGVTANFTIEFLDYPATIDQVRYTDEVLSDTFQLCTDAISYFKSLAYIRAESQVNLTPLFNVQDTNLDGWQFNLVISTDFIVQSCYVKGYIEPQEYAVKCIEANNEYMSSPAGDYFTDVVDLDMEVVYSGYVDDGSTPLLVSMRTGSQTILRIGINGTSVNYYIRTPIGGIQFGVHTFISGSTPINGSIKVKGTATDIELYFDDVLVLSTPEVNTDLTIFNVLPLYFATQTGVSGLYTGNINSVKIGTEEWTFPEGTGSTTTSSEGTITTLNSDVSTEDMWQFDTDTEEMWIDANNYIDFTGEIITYDDSLKFKTIFNSVFIPQRDFLDDYLVYDGQSIYDLSVQLYGSSEEGLTQLIPVLDAINNGVITVGTLIPRKVPISNIAQQFNDNNVLIATVPQAEIVPTTGGFDYTFDFVWGVGDDTQDGILESGLEFGLIS